MSKKNPANIIIQTDNIQIRYNKKAKTYIIESIHNVSNLAEGDFNELITLANAILNYSPKQITR
jgi:hypothetical protein